MNIHIFLFLILLATVANLFYRPALPPSAASSKMRSFLSKKHHLVDPAFYIQPPRPTDCSLETSRLVFSASGWLCQNKPYWKGEYRIACKHLQALDNTANLLVDVFTDTPAEDDADPFETYLNERGERVPKYKCHCGSLDDRGNRMISVTPYQCVPDYCTRELQNVPSLGWNGHRCECELFHHVDPNDPTSPCVRHTNRYQNRLVYGRVECSNKNSLKLLPVLCPTNTKVLYFTKRVATSKDPMTFIQLHLNDQPSISTKTETTLS